LFWTPLENTNKKEKKKTKKKNREERMVEMRNINHNATTHKVVKGHRMNGNS
jgi:hypothetical protein